VENGLFISFEMNRDTNSNGNGKSGQQFGQLPKKTESEAASNLSDVKESLVTFQTADGLEMQGVPSHVTRHLVVFELYNPTGAPRLSEVLSGFKIVLQGRTIYSGRVVVRNVVNTELKVVCEATLNEAHWINFDLSLVSQHNGQLAEEFKSFLEEWQKIYKVLPEFKVVIADMQIFLADLQIWLEQVEMGIRSSPTGDRQEMEQQLAQQLGQSIVPAFDVMHERLEALSERIDEDLRPVHRSFSKRQLHPLVLCSPFAHRAYHKPLGYAGDYEMVNMIARSPYEGASLFAKIVNLWFLSQWPSKAHRNRLAHLGDSLQAETLRVTGKSHGKARVFNFACGPAVEVQQFIRNSSLSDYADLTFADFNAETIEYTSRAINALKKEFDRGTALRFQRKSVHQILKEGLKPVVSGGGPKQEYDFIYCAGLFDYLPDHTCRQLMGIFYDWLAPGGLLTVTNVNDYKPFRHMLEFVLDWNLIYRDAKRASTLIPERVPADAKRVTNDSTGVNVFVEVRKPSHA
jgi:extracellular factor (EF) 3-hydroxypalmitic acid methyl ester biosynthesis protein